MSSSERIWGLSPRFSLDNQMNPFCLDELRSRSTTTENPKQSTDRKTTIARIAGRTKELGQERQREVVKDVNCGTSKS